MSSDHVTGYVQSATGLYSDRRLRWPYILQTFDRVLRKIRLNSILSASVRMVTFRRKDNNRGAYQLDSIVIMSNLLSARLEYGLEGKQIS